MVSWIVFSAPVFLPGCSPGLPSTTLLPQSPRLSPPPLSSALPGCSFAACRVCVCMCVCVGVRGCAYACVYDVMCVCGGFQ